MNSFSLSLFTSGNPVPANFDPGEPASVPYERRPLNEEKLRAGVKIPAFLPYFDELQTTGETPEMRYAYRRMLADPTIKAAFCSKIFSVMSLDLVVSPPKWLKKDARSIEIAEFAEWNLKSGTTEGVPGLVWDVLSGALIDGFSVSEKVWAEPEPKGRWAGKRRLACLKAKDVYQDLVIEIDEFKNIVAVKGLRYNAGERFDPHDFVIYTHLGLFENPTGMSDFRAVYGKFWLLDTVWKLRAIACDKRSMPIMVGHWKDASQKKTLEAALSRVRYQNWISAPEEAKIEALNIAGQADQIFKDTIRDLKEEITTGLKGAILTQMTGQGQRGDSKVHEDTSNAFEWYLSASILNVLNGHESGLIRHIVDVNFQGVGDYPKAAFGGVDDAELKESLAIDQALFEMGWPLDKDEMESRYGRKYQEDAEKALKKPDPQAGGLGNMMGAMGGDQPGGPGAPGGGSDPQAGPDGPGDDPADGDDLGPDDQRADLISEILSGVMGDTDDAMDAIHDEDETDAETTQANSDEPQSDDEGSIGDRADLMADIVGGAMGDADHEQFDRFAEAIIPEAEPIGRLEKTALASRYSAEIDQADNPNLLRDAFLFAFSETGGLWRESWAIANEVADLAGYQSFAESYPLALEELADDDRLAIDLIDQPRADADDRELAAFYADLWNALDEAGHPASDDEIEKVTDELAAFGWTIEKHAGRWIAERAPHEFAEQARAPKGGVTVAGKHYPGGRWIPAKEMAKATPEERKAVEEPQEARKSARRERGTVDVSGIRKLIGDAATATLSEPETRRANRTFRALKSHHGDLLHHRLEELAKQMRETHDAVDNDVQREFFAKQLAAVGVMLDKAGDAPEIEKPAEKPTKKPAKKTSDHFESLAAIDRPAAVDRKEKEPWEMTAKEWGENNHAEQMKDEYRSSAAPMLKDAWNKAGKTDSPNARTLTQKQVQKLIDKHGEGIRGNPLITSVDRGEFGASSLYGGDYWLSKTSGGQYMIVANDKDFQPNLTHKRELQTALAAGKPVPPEVLADYPDLAESSAKPPQGAAPPSPGFTGIDANGHKWVDGEQVKRDDPEEATTSPGAVTEIDPLDTIQEGGNADEKPVDTKQPAADGLGRAELGRDYRDSPAGDAPDAPARSNRVLLDREEHTRPADLSRVPGHLRQHLNDAQQFGVAKALDSLDRVGGFLLADGTGVGKTRQLLAVADHYARGGKKVVIVAPSEVIKPDWKKGTVGGSYAGDGQSMGVSVSLAKGDVPLTAGKIAITTYNEIGKLKVDADTVVIFDESHALKNSNSKRGKAGREIGFNAGKVMYATATPADKPLHIAHLIRAGVFGGGSESAGKFFGKAADTYQKLGLRQETFYNRFAGREITKWSIDPRVGAQEVARRISGLMDQMTRDGLMVQRSLSLDNVATGVHQVTLPDEAKTAMAAAFDAAMSGHNGNKAAALMAMRHAQEPHKIPAAVDFVKAELAAGRQPIVFLGRVNDNVDDDESDDDDEGMVDGNTARQLKEALIEAGIPAEQIGELHGAATKTAAQKQSAMKSFQDGKKPILISTIQSGGTGINLDDTKGDRPRSMCIMTPPLGGNDALQAAGRINRLSTKSNARLTYIISDHPIDKWNMALLGKKMSTMGAVLGKGLEKLIGDVAGPEEKVEPFDWGTSLIRPPQSTTASTPSPAAPSQSPPPASTPTATAQPKAASQGPPTRQVNTKRGTRHVISWSPSKTFWDLRRAGRLPDAVGVGKDPRTGDWEATIWGESPSHAHDVFGELAKIGAVDASTKFSEHADGEGFMAPHFEGLLAAIRDKHFGDNKLSEESSR